MLKLHVFLVDTGIMFTFDMEMALESVSKLMETAAEVTQIPANKQVLLIANGEPLNPSSRVGSYKSAGTETNPIFLFSKSAIESPQPPTPNSSVHSELSLEQQVERCLQMPPTIETLVSRAILASEFHFSARKLGDTCEYLVNDQQLQQQGWQAVVSNLENITLALNKHASVFEDQYKRFLSTREQYLGMFERFDDVIALLSKIPILPCLARPDCDSEANKIYLLDWINSKENKASLHTLVSQCKDLLTQFNENMLENLMSEIKKVLDSSDNRSMKDIKGLDERLLSLQQRLVVAKQFVQDQADMAQGFKQNQLRAEHIGDSSVLPDLCASHRKQLLVLLRNHKQLRDICSLCTKAKDELTANLHARLRWVMYVEHSICKCDSKLLVFHESLKKMKRRLEALEQVFEAPRMYVLAVLEIFRRRSFSFQFLEWGRNVSLSSSEARSEEIEKRNKFSDVFGNHFLHSLFAGLDDVPPSFAESPPRIFDEILPIIDVDDIRALQHEVPELLVELSLNDSMEQSFYMKEKLSQTNLSKLCDPKSNPKLVETLRLRELTGTNGIPKMTVSQLQKEISQEDIAFDLTKNQMNWQLGESTMSIPAGDFEPSSLKTLPSEFEGLQSSQSSEISDSMFRSAEGLVEQDVQKIDSPSEMVGVLDLSEETGLHEEGRTMLETPSKIHDKNIQCKMLPITKNVVKDETNSKEILVKDMKESMDDEHLDDSTSLKSSLLTKRILQSALVTVDFCRLDFVKMKEEVISLFFDWNNYVEIFNQNIIDGFEALCSKEVQTSRRNRDLEAMLESEKKSRLEILNEMKIELEKRTKATDEEHSEEMNQLEARLKIEYENKRKEDAEKWQDDVCELRVKYEREKSYELTRLKSELKASCLEIEELNEKTDRLNEKIETLEKELELKEKQYRKIECEKESAEKLNIKMKEEAQYLRTSKSQLESENQKYFNSALNQVKKEKEKTIKELQVVINDLKIEIETRGKMSEKVLSENGHYKVVNSKIMSRLEVLENDKEKLEVSYNELKKELLQLQCDMDSERASHSSALDRLREEMEKRFEGEKLQLIEIFEAEKSNLKEESSLQMVKLIEDFKKQRSALKEESEREKLEMQEKLKKEKAALVSSFEVEKGKLTEEFEKQQSLSKASSIEEGIDALEWEKVLQNLRDLETENELLKAEIKRKDSLQNEVEELQKVCDELEKENKRMKENVTDSQFFFHAASSKEHCNRISFHQFKTNDLVVLCYDEIISSYVVLTTEDTKYFLHPDSKSAMNLREENSEDFREWLLVYITGQEYCVAKKAHNRFKLPVNTYFYRIHARPWTL